MTTLDPATWAQASGALAAVLLLAWGAARVLRRTPLATGAAGRAGRRLRVEESLALDARRRVLLLRCDGRELLLLTGGGAEDRVLGWLPRPDAGPAEDRP